MPIQHSDLVELARRLKHEKLFVANERKEIEGLNRKVELLSTGLFHQTWLTGQNRLALENLARGAVQSPFARPYVVPPVEGENDLNENLELIEASKHIPYKHLPFFVELLLLLRSHPEVVGLCISTFEKQKSMFLRLAGASFGEILQAILDVFGGISGPLPSDGNLLLKLLSSVAGYQLKGSESPRKSLRESTAFSTMYRLISETIPSSRLFLIGALHQPVTLLLSSQDLWFVGSNVPPTSPVNCLEGPNCFSSPSTNGDIASLDRTEKIAKLTKIFVESILDHLHAFPKGLAWLIRTIYSELTGAYSEKEVSLICTDLIWALFICPAVTNPEPFGVTDAPVGNEARHVLSQIATILQALALHRWEGTDPRMAEYISYFDTDSLSSVLDHVLQIDGLPTDFNGTISALRRRKLLIPENLLQPLLLWLKECLCMLERNGKLTELEIFPELVRLVSLINEYYDTQRLSTQTSNTSHSGSNSPQVPSTHNSPSHTASSLLANGKRTFLSRKGGGDSGRPNKPNNLPVPQPMDASTVATVAVVEFTVTSESWEYVGLLPESEVIGMGSKSGSTGDADSIGTMDLDAGEEEDRDESSNIVEKRTRFSLSTDDGTMDKVDWDFENHVFVHCNYRDGKVVKLSGATDILEAVSEAASTHSVSSSIELEDPNDNLSDMLSANVSGRGTPNVSGRNTPQDENDEDRIDAGNSNDGDNTVAVNNSGVSGAANVRVANNPPARDNLNPPNLMNLNITPRTPQDGPSKQARSEIEDKFCKFEIKKLGGGGADTVSLVSDTWSTDVLASDSEMGGELREALNLPPPLIPFQGSAVSSSSAPPSVAPIQSNFSPAVSNPSILEAMQNTDTISEAWSTEVAANDIERMHDFDNDDTSSVARSDDTGRSDGLEEIAYDTPRSSVSGGGSYMRPDQEHDLLLLELVPHTLDILATNPGSNNPVSAPEQESSSNAMDVEVPPLPVVTETRIARSTAPLVPVDVAGPSSSIRSSNNIGSGVGTNRSGVSSKTITFDVPAERGDRESLDEENGRTKKLISKFIRLPFRQRGRKLDSSRHGVVDLDKFNLNDSPSSLHVPKLRKSLSEDVSSPSNQGSNESSDDILAKYRRKPSLTESNDGSIPGAKDLQHSSPKFVNFSLANGSMGVSRRESIKITRAEMIQEARRKLRFVISNCDLQQLQASEGLPVDVALMNMLRLEVANAISMADQNTAAQLQEAIRTVKQLGLDGCRKAIRLLRDDYRRRSEFVAYLMKSKQTLLTTILYLEKATVRAKHEGDTYSHYLIKECIRMWLEEPQQDNLITTFKENFKSATAVDEKIEALEMFLETLMIRFVGSKELTEWQLSVAATALEQTVVSRIYTYALYPNGDADMHRDAVLRDHIARLEAIITPSHRDLQIPKSHLAECPWPPAQRELRMLAAYKTPFEKLKCISRAASFIVSLLASADKTVSADDVVPVLVFVIIKVNPSALLSTIQYVNSFCGQKTSGEEMYWWTQFCSAVEFIKTMDYSD